MTHLIDSALDQGVLTLTLANGVAHPLSLAMIQALHDHLRAAALNPDIRVIILHGPGRIFCAGHDLKEIASHRNDPDQGRAYVTELFEKCSAMMQDITNAPQPVIALVEGIATAGGLQLVGACDLAFASPDARFCLPGVNNGGFCTTPAVSVSRNLSRKHIMEMALSGEVFDATWARENGLINRVLPEDELVDFTTEFSRKLATRNPRAIRDGKRALNQHLHLPLDQAYDLATQVMIGHFMDPQRIETEPHR